MSVPTGVCLPVPAGGPEPPAPLSSKRESEKPCLHCSGDIFYFPSLAQVFQKAHFYYLFYQET